MNDPLMPILVTDEVYQKRLAAVNYARGSVRLEGFVWPPEVELIHKKYICGVITAEQRRQAITKIYTNDATSST